MRIESGSCARGKISPGYSHIQSLQRALELLNGSRQSSWEINGQIF